MMHDVLLENVPAIAVAAIEVSAWEIVTYYTGKDYGEIVASIMILTISITPLLFPVTNTPFGPLYENFRMFATKHMADALIGTLIGYLVVWMRRI